MSVGKDEFSSQNLNFCQGLPSCNSNQLWSDFGANQRDVYFYIKADQNSDDSWQYYCRYSMTTNYAEFQDTIREMLALTVTADVQPATDTLTLSPTNKPTSNPTETITFETSFISTSENNQTSLELYNSTSLVDAGLSDLINNVNSSNSGVVVNGISSSMERISSSSCKSTKNLSFWSLFVGFVFLVNPFYL